MISLVHALPWHLVDPAAVAFDPGPAAEIAARLVLPLGQRKAVTDADRRGCERDLDTALLARYGPAVAGWNWSIGEGGPVRRWCCAPHSLVNRHATAAQSVERVVAAVTEWRAFLEQLARAQADLLDETASLALEDRVERAVVHYVAIAVAHTGGEDAWYNTVQAALRWHLDAVGDGGAAVDAIVEATIAGRFHSWCAPDGDAVAEAAAELALRVGEARATTPDTSDALGAWWITRGRTDWRSAAWTPGAAVASDGHRAFIAGHDAARSAERARRMDDALDFIRAEARAQRPLAWSMLREAQRRVLGEAAVGFRAGDAFAHGGRERYGFDAHTRGRFERCLAEVSDASLPATSRAARAYLDVCFFHPFTDGNARAARLALDYVLRTAGLALHTAEPVFLLPRRGDDPDVGWDVARLVGQLAGASP